MPKQKVCLATWLGRWVVRALPIPEAHRLMESNSTGGKIVVVR
jgi:hypothetical protein